MVLPFVVVGLMLKGQKYYFVFRNLYSDLLLQESIREKDLKIFP